MLCFNLMRVFNRQTPTYNQSFPQPLKFSSNDDDGSNADDDDDDDEKEGVAKTIKETKSFKL